MVIVGQVGDDRVELLITMAAAAVDSRDGKGVDVLVLGAARLEPPPGICSHLFNEFPDLKIMVMATSGDTKGAAKLYWQGLRSRQQGIVAATALPNHIHRLTTTGLSLRLPGLRVSLEAHSAPSNGQGSSQGINPWNHLLGSTISCGSAW